MRMRIFVCRLVLSLAIAAAFAFPCTGQAPSPPTAAQPAPGESAPKSDPVRMNALELYRSGKMAQAMPLFETLCTQYPRDVAMWEAWGMSTLGYSQTLPDPAERKKNRALARSRLLKAGELGDNSNLLHSVLPNLPEDGGEGNFSASKEVNDIMQHAEADYSRGDYEKAKDGYLHALLLEPKNYDAALFMGDVCFKQRDNATAGEWFARAMEIDPNRETAYRYWGDALSAMGKSSDAREKYIQAIVADPYNSRSSIGLNQWAQRVKVKLNWVRLQDKAKIVASPAGPKIDIDPSLHSEDPMFKPWMAYYGRRLQWRQGVFKQQFPAESQCRHTLNEEVEALRLLLFGLSKTEPAANLDPSLAALAKIDQAGFLEPFALLNRADKELAVDYVPYRNAHREIVYRYFDEFVVPKAPR